MRPIAVVLAIAMLANALPSAARAQSVSGEIDIAVNDAATKAPIPLARVLLDGPVITAEFTGANGKVRFTEVPDGIYRARVFARSYRAVTSKEFEVINGSAVTVEVALAQTFENLKIIGSVTAKSTASVSTTSLSQDSAQRKLSSSLTDALGKLSGVTVSTSSSDSDATQTISLNGHDASQTALTVDGIPLNAPGTAGDMRMFNSDLFTGAAVHQGPQIGGLGGGVAFQTLEPTLSWQGDLLLSTGSNGKFNYSASDSGSIGKFGIAAMHTYRLSPSLIDGMRYLDASGLDYTHEGDGVYGGDLLKVRYDASESQAITGTFMSSTRYNEIACLQMTGALPCGYGPGNSHEGHFNLYSLQDDALIGDTSVVASFYGTVSANESNLLDRYVNGQAQPTGFSQSGDTTGFTLNATLPARQRHTISISAYSANTSTKYAPLVPQARPYVAAPQHASYSAITLNDDVRSNANLHFDSSLGISHASNAPSSVLAGIGATWQPTQSDTYSFSYNVGGVAAHAGRFGALSDPESLRYDCNGGVAYGSAPGDEPGSSSSTSARLGYTHRLRSGEIGASLYRQVQMGTVLPAQVNGTVLEGLGVVPPGYFGLVQGVYDSPAGCGAAPGTPFGAQNVYFFTPIGGVKRVYEGGSISGFFSIGNLVVQPFYDLTMVNLDSNDPRIDNPYSIEIPGAQVPGVPMHRAGLTLDYKTPRSAFEYLLTAQYTGGNNWQNLPAHTVVDAGISTLLSRGTLTFAANNVFNTYGGIFAGSAYAVPYTTLGGTKVATIARPDSPRAYAVTYSVRVGQSAATRNAISSAGLPHAGRRGPRRGFFAAMAALPSAAPSDPLAVSQSGRCSPVDARTAGPILGGLKAYVARIEAAKTSAGYPPAMAAPAIPGIAVTYHGLKTTYALAIVVTKLQEMRAIFPCAALHVTTQEEARQRGLYMESGPPVFFRPSIAFMPSVGLYFVRRPPTPGAESFRFYRLPALPPKDPFAVLPGPACTPELRSTATEVLSELSAHFATGAATPSWTITPQAAKAGTWYALNATDLGVVPAILNCARVAAAPPAGVTAAGWSGQRLPALNYAAPFGLYIIAPPRMAGPPSPQPSPTP